MCSYQKVGTFRVVNGQKQGGNVVSYFTLPNGRVLHVVAGPVDAKVLLREARWVVETWKLGLVGASSDSPKFKEMFRKAHAERLQREHGIDLRLARIPQSGTLESFATREFRRPGNDKKCQIHRLLTVYPLAKTD